ncbi:serine/arginine repetitive matrix protein 1-like, partial [Scaptodrosophila lebanonensis]|uniref:Serine/arginine repetitive matrix protein 1-like n=1 Tax=Drosophila lebanonensis TaxID=7225 RepID=A0A6J2U3R9_DROLE
MIQCGTVCLKLGPGEPEAPMHNENPDLPTSRRRSTTKVTSPRPAPAKNTSVPVTSRQAIERCCQQHEDDNEENKEPQSPSTTTTTQASPFDVTELAEEPEEPDYDSMERNTGSSAWQSSPEQDWEDDKSTSPYLPQYQDGQSPDDPSPASSAPNNEWLSSSEPENDDGQSDERFRTTLQRDEWDWQESPPPPSSESDTPPERHYPDNVREVYDEDAPPHRGFRGPTYPPRFQGHQDGGSYSRSPKPEPRRDPRSGRGVYKPAEPQTELEHYTASPASESSSDDEQVYYREVVASAENYQHITTPYGARVTRNTTTTVDIFLPPGETMSSMFNVPRESRSQRQPRRNTSPETVQRPTWEPATSDEEDNRPLFRRRYSRAPTNATTSEAAPAEWVVAPTGWKVDTKDRKIPQALVEDVMSGMHKRTRARYSKELDGQRFQVERTKTRR